MKELALIGILICIFLVIVCIVIWIINYFITDLYPSIQMFKEDLQKEKEKRKRNELH